MRIEGQGFTESDTKVSAQFSPKQFQIGKRVDKPEWESCEYGSWRTSISCSWESRDEVQSWSSERVQACLKAPGPEALLHLARLRYLGSLWRTAPLEVWWAIHYAGVWVPTLQTAIDWLHTHTKGLDFAAGATWRRDNLTDIVADSKAWKNLLHQAKQHSIETNAATEHLHRWHYHFVHRAVELGLQADPDHLLRKGLLLDGPVQGDPPPHACLLCGEAFTTYAGWSVHANRKHGRVAPERLLLHGSSCQVCCREYHTSQRLMRHLR